MSSAFGKCTCCDRLGPLDAHHKFPKRKWAMRLYRDLIHSQANIQFACNGCHASHASPNLIHWNEQQFCEALGLQPRSKTAQFDKKGSCL